jgi:hypothetical protein
VSRIGAVLAAAVLAALSAARADGAQTTAQSIGLLVPGRLQAQAAYAVFPESLRALGYRDGAISASW